MTRRYLVNWSIWIGLWSGIYVFFYMLSPLGQYGMLPATFIGLPIYFLAGAKKEEFLDFVSSAVAGVVWALFYLFCIGALLDAGIPGYAAQGLVVGIVTALLCAIHFNMPVPFCTRIPMMFGAIAFTFITNASHPIATMATFTLGIGLAFWCNYGTRFLDAEGNWTLAAVMNR